MALAYWIAQAVFVIFCFLPPVRDVTEPRAGAFLLLGLAAVQLALMGWRLWIAKSWPGLALAPPISTVGLWFALAPWAAAEVGGDGRGLAAGMATIVWGLFSYFALGAWAGTRPVVARATTRTRR